MSAFPIVLLLLIPTGGAIIGALLPSNSMAKTWALLVSLATAAVGLYLAANFNFDSGAAQFTLKPGPDSFLTLPALGASLNFGLTSIGLWLVLLTVFLMPLAILSSFESIKDREKEFYAWMLALLAAMLGVFIARDVLLFYVFF